MPKILIVGGGISGLSIAFRVRQYLTDTSVTILESGKDLGGKIATRKEEGFIYETGPNGFLDNNPSTLQLVRDLGLDSELVEASESASKNRFLFLNGKLQLLPGSPWELIKTGILSWKAKFCLLWERFCSAKPPIQDESIDEFARRRVGQEIAEKLVDPFVTGIFAGDSRLISLRAGFPRIHTMEVNHGSISAGLKANRIARKAEGKSGRASGRLWSLRNGLGEIITALANKIGPESIIHSAATSVAYSNQTRQWITTDETGQEHQSDILILTCPAFIQAKLLENLSPPIATNLKTIPYNQVAVAIMGFRSGDIPIPLDGFGFLIPSKENRSILGAQWCSSIYRGRAPAGMVLLRVILGGPKRPELVDMDDDSLSSLAYRELQTIMNVQAPPLFCRIVRWKNAIPQYNLGHLDKVGLIEKELNNHPGLYLGGNALKGVAINDCVENAESMAVRVARWWNKEGKDRNEK
ncbi:MAG: hypothetical protein RL595_480 [Planctomycetota bacterium]|jgi:oxygen-dependent protoporphyrinogen oxidase